MEVRGEDLVACVAIPTLAFLIYSGHNGAAASLLATIIGWYFAKKAYAKKE